MGARHRDHYTAMALELDAPGRADYGGRLAQVEVEIDNLRAAFVCSRDHGDPELALQLASSLQPLWLARGRVREGLALLHAAFGDLDAQHADAALRARALADMAVLGMWVAPPSASIRPTKRWRSLANSRIRRSWPGL